MNSISELTPPERDAILAGLRLLQNEVMDGNVDTDIDLIYTNCGEHSGLPVPEIDVLAEKINQ
jgi:hypothetical protein